MDFFDQEAHARRQTRLLGCLFGLAVLAFIVLTYLILAIPILVFFKISAADFSQWIWEPRLALCVVVGTLLSTTLGCLYKMHLFSGGGVAVAELLGGREIGPSPTDQDEKRLRDVIEEMAIAASLPVPEIYLLDRERGINAFAAGHARDDVAIGVTVGCLKLLTRDELQGVIAHEFMPRIERGHPVEHETDGAGTRSVLADDCRPRSGARNDACSGNWRIHF
jgi:Zn-dependent protease with chaperone function